MKQDNKIIEEERREIVNLISENLNQGRLKSITSLTTDILDYKNNKLKLQRENELKFLIDLRSKLDEYVDRHRENIWIGFGYHITMISNRIKELEEQK